MVKTIEYILNYRIKGTKFTKTLEIDFIPNQRHEDYSQIQKEILTVQKKWNNIKGLEQEIYLLIETKEKNCEEAIQNFKDEIDKLENEIRNSKVNNLLERRFKLIKDILIDNGYESDSELMTFEFWSNSVDAATINEFLELCIWKDFDKKKRVL